MWLTIYYASSRFWLPLALYPLAILCNLQLMEFLEFLWKSLSRPDLYVVVALVCPWKKLRILLRRLKVLCWRLHAFLLLFLRGFLWLSLRHERITKDYMFSPSLCFVLLVLNSGALGISPFPSVHCTHIFPRVTCSHKNFMTTLYSYLWSKVWVFGRNWFASSIISPETYYMPDFNQFQQGFSGFE